MTGASTFFLDFLPWLATSGVPPRALSTPLASRFFKDSFFSRCSRAGCFLARAAAKSGLSGDETAGTCCSSSMFIGRFCGITVGVELRGRDGVSAISEDNRMEALRKDFSMSVTTKRYLFVERKIYLGRQTLVWYVKFA